MCLKGTDKDAAALELALNRLDFDIKVKIYVKSTQKFIRNQITPSSNSDSAQLYSTVSQGYSFQICSRGPLTIRLLYVCHYEPWG